MAVIRARKLITDADIPAAIARDSETVEAMAAHTNATDPHPIYLTQTEGDERYRQSAVPLTNVDIPAVIARDSETAAVMTAHINSTDPHSEYLSKHPTGIEFGANTVNIIDFHTGQALDFDARFIAIGGDSNQAGANVALQANLFTLVSKFNFHEGATLSRIFMASTYIDLPSIGSQSVYDIFISIPGAVLGDLAFFVPTTDLFNGLWPFNIQAAVTNSNIARIYFHNLYGAAVDVPAFPAKLIVIGF